MGKFGEITDVELVRYTHKAKGKKNQSTGYVLFLVVSEIFQIIFFLTCCYFFYQLRIRTLSFNPNRQTSGRPQRNQSRRPTRYNSSISSQCRQYTFPIIYQPTRINSLKSSFNTDNPPVPDSNNNAPNPNNGTQNIREGGRYKA